MQDVERYGQPVVSQLVYERTKEQRDHWRERAELLEVMIKRVKALPTYSLSQGMCIDPSPDRLLKADQVYRIIGSPASGGTVDG